MNNFAVDLSTGYCYSTAKTAEDEVKQGRSYYQAAYWQFYQILYLSNIIDQLSDNIVDPQTRTVAKIFNELLPALGLVACPVVAAIKQGHYEEGMKQFDKLTSSIPSPISVKILPRNLRPRTISFYSYLAENIGNFTRVGMISSVAALALFNPYSAATIMGPVLYEAVDSHGLIPLRISRCVERNMPILTTAAFITGGSRFNQVYTICSVANYYTSFNQRMYQAIDSLAHRCMKIAGPTLVEIDAPFYGSNDPTYTDIITLLNSKDSDFELNYAHCSKFAFMGMKFEKSLNFDNFLKLFDEVDWTQNVQLIRLALKDDESFLAYLRKMFPLIDVPAGIETILKSIADVDQVRESYLKIQMDRLVKILSGKKRVKGRLKDLEESIDNFGIILSYLEKLDSNKQAEKVEKEDILMKLAIDCGSNCARGIQACAQEVVEGIITKRLNLAKNATSEPSEIFTFRLWNSLQKLRENILNSTYLKMLEKSFTFLKDGQSVVVDDKRQTTEPKSIALAQDLTLIDQHRKILALGFFPLTQFQRDNFEITDFITWSSSQLRHIRAYMYEKYVHQMDDAVKEIGELHGFKHIMHMLQNNMSISEKQLEEILKIYTTRNNQKWTLEETYHRFHRLIFLKMGVLRVCEEGLLYMVMNDDQDNDKDDPWMDVSLMPSTERGGTAVSHHETNQKVKVDYDVKEEWSMVHHSVDVAKGSGIDVKHNS